MKSACTLRAIDSWLVSSMLQPHSFPTRARALLLARRTYNMLGDVIDLDFIRSMTATVKTH